ncbi:MAG: hypothetical protein ACTSVY_01830 [Candidatus Helarchaeota archaeon]
MTDKCSSCRKVVEVAVGGFGREVCESCGAILCSNCIKTLESKSGIKIYCYTCYAKESVKRRKGR